MTRRMSRRQRAATRVVMALCFLAAEQGASEAQMSSEGGSGTWVPTLSIKAGVFSTTLRIDDSVTTFSRRQTPYIALALGGRQQGRFELASEIGLTRKGAVREFASERRDYWHFWSIEVPILVRLNLGMEDASVRSFIVAGPSLDFRLENKATIAGREWDLSGNTAWLGVNGVVGAGLEWRRFSVEARYHHGLRGLVTDPNILVRSQLHSRAALVLAGYRLY